MGLRIIVDSVKEKEELLKNPVFKKLEKHISVEKPKKKRTPVERRTLTAKEVKFAAENKLPVYYTETYFSPYDKHMNYKGKCVMKKANVGYYIGNSDINPDDYTPDHVMEGEFGEGTFSIQSVPGVKYE